MDDDLFTPESMAQFRQRTTEAAGSGQQLLQQYRSDHEAQIAGAPDLQSWIDTLEDGDLAAATDAGLWSRMARLGFIEFPTPRTLYPDHGVFVVRIISPKIFDAFRNESGARSDYAFTTVKVCLRRDPVPRSLAVPKGWSNPALIDTELFELSPDVTEDMFDDLEKITLSTWRRRRTGGSSASRSTSALEPGKRTGPGHSSARLGAGSACTATT